MVEEEYQGFLSTSKRGYDIIFHSMDAKNLSYSDTAEKEALKSELAAAYDFSGFDYLVAADDAALSFVDEFHSTLFYSLPTFFFGVNDNALANRMADKSGFAGILEIQDYVGLVELAASCLPNASSINIVSDSTSLGKAKESQFRNDVSAVSPLPIKTYNFSAYHTNDLSSLFASLPSSDINVLLECTLDADGVLHGKDYADYIRKGLSAPLWRPKKDGKGDYIVGGSFYNFHFSGQIIANLVNIVANGANIDDYGLLTISANSKVIDYALSKKYSFDLSKLPSGTFVEGYSPSFFERNPFLAAFLVAAAILLLLIVVMFALFYARKQKIMKRLEESNVKLSESQKELKKAVGTDFLTGLYNHSRFSADLKALVEKGAPFHLMMMDVNSFKGINDIFGHLAGDDILAGLGEFLLSFAGPNVKVYRYGGDEFSLLSEGLSNEEADGLAVRILEVRDRAFKTSGGEVKISLTIGIAGFPHDAEDPKTLIGKADRALYYQKKMQINGSLSFFDEGQMPEESDPKTISETLKKALGEKRIQLHFQPAFNYSKNAVSAYEGLMRIEGSSYGPDVFIPVAEKAGLINEVGRLALEESLLFLAKLNSEGHNDIYVFFNFSGAQASDAGFFPLMKKRIAELKLDPRYVVIELTEKVFINDPNYYQRFFDSVKDIGVKVSLDDFGVGYFFLNKLVGGSFSFVKLNKGVIDQLYLTPGLVKGLIDLAHELGVKVVAEGIETKNQFLDLQELGADYIQGFCLSKALPPAEAVAFLAEKHFSIK